ncbi:hypothetical protein [Mongoliimonas terrestris]|uniref:hypothetical protein n=1 Tax=Mongoliimonas terrestris TaxID=1709001 RepID=UPI0009495769|nr:hypothetical protein [Mongoliimonas terrestris]
MSSLHAPSKSVALVSSIPGRTPVDAKQRRRSAVDIRALRDLALVALAFGFIAALTFGFPLPH